MSRYVDVVMCGVRRRSGVVRDVWEGRGGLG